MECLVSNKFKINSEGKELMYTSYSATDDPGSSIVNDF